MGLILWRTFVVEGLGCFCGGWMVVWFIRYIISWWGLMVLCLIAYSIRGFNLFQSRKENR
ncbi:hypothetical protein BDV30DRAFT_208972 [Aspergillus minisclerotigenes]|uniref:Uncharacterized protein n=1 Tax=Aspergillus minisclerotigenes TaxID=656917 RepID=A0A5N6J6C4_9EURO|nr:hypothetical protein BDV30DRAFT_208972 [Aspergillus minisclerotigenes]